MSAISDILNAIVRFLLMLAKIGAIIALLYFASLVANSNWLLAFFLICIAIGIFGALLEEGRGGGR